MTDRYGDPVIIFNLKTYDHLTGKKPDNLDAMEFIKTSVEYFAGIAGKPVDVLLELSSEFSAGRASRGYTLIENQVGNLPQGYRDGKITADVLDELPGVQKLSSIGYKINMGSLSLRLGPDGESIIFSFRLRYDSTN